MPLIAPSLAVLSPAVASFTLSVPPVRLSPPVPAVSEAPLFVPPFVALSPAVLPVVVLFVPAPAMSFSFLSFLLLPQAVRARTIIRTTAREIVFFILFIITSLFPEIVPDFLLRFTVT